MSFQVWDLLLQVLKPVRGDECQDKTFVWDSLEQVNRRCEIGMEVNFKLSGAHFA